MHNNESAGAFQPTCSYRSEHTDSFCWLSSEGTSGELVERSGGIIRLEQQARHCINGKVSE